MVSDEVLSVRGALRRFEGGHRALCGVDLDIIPGQVTALLGPSGSGKSTLLRAIAGLEHLDDGTIRMGDTLWSGPGKHCPPEIRRVGLVFQDYALFPHMNALDNVAFGLKGADRKERALHQLKHAELAGKARNFPHELSGGEQQRVALARALAPEPSIILLDEPFSGLDRRLRGDVRRRTMTAIRKSGAAALLVTHDAEEALEAADQLALMQDGEIIQTGTPKDVWFNPVSADAARLVGDIDVAQGKVRSGKVESVFGDLPADQMEDGITVDILVRPEGVSVTQGEAFEVSGEDYAGAQVRLELKASDGSLWHAQTSATTGLQRGDRVGLGLDPDFVRIVEQG
ncbi:MAG: ABC transporter ATP-binding protein [Alphaproteobacteria bacterium]|nr:ABC transporter ATP-binding protein [Alphaproteobacteria bacterium]